MRLSVFVREVNYNANEIYIYIYTLNSEELKLSFLFITV